MNRVQKKLPLDDVMVKQLRRAGLIEGRRPNLHVSALVAKATGTQADYLRTGEMLFKGQDVFQVGAAPAVDGLVVIPYHRKGAVFLRQVADIDDLPAGILVRDMSSG